MSDDRKNPLWPWIVALMIGLPVVYVLSSGPARPLLMRQYTIHANAQSFQFPAFGALDVTVTKPGIWTSVYAPLDWASRQKMGMWLQRYWELFPIPVEP